MYCNQYGHPKIRKTHTKKNIVIGEQWHYLIIPGIWGFSPKEKDKPK
jgi:hypothetical protein